MLRFTDAHWRFMEKVNGHAPFFGCKSLDNSDSFFPMWTAMLRFLYDFGIHHTSLTTGERQCSVFSSDFQRFRRYWTDMLRFLDQFQADFQLTSGWIRPLRVGGHAPFSPHDFSQRWEKWVFLGKGEWFSLFLYFRDAPTGLRRKERIQMVAHLLPLMSGEVELPKLEQKGRDWLEQIRMETMKGASVTNETARQMLKNWRKQGLIVILKDKHYQKITATI